MRLDCVNIPIKDHDCVVVLDEEFARYGENGKNLDYGIVFGSTWILPLNRTNKKQQKKSDYVKVLNQELLPEIKEQLYSIYMYYKKYQKLPDPSVDIQRIVDLMKDDVAAYEEEHNTKNKAVSPFDADPTEDSFLLIESDDDELDDFI